MRKIVSRIDRDNTTAALLTVLVLIGGCGGGGDGGKAAAPAGAVHRSTACPLVIDDSALAGFFDLATRVETGEPVSLDAMTATANEPVWDRWRRSFEPDVMPAAQLGRAFFITLRGRDALPERLRDKPARLDLDRNYIFHLERRREIEAYVAAFTADDLACGVRETLAGWVDAAVLADTLRIDFVVGHPEIRLFEDHVMLDAGMAWASGRNQIIRFIASTICRNADAVTGTAPDRASGPGILLESLRLVSNEAVPAYIDDLAGIILDPRHPVLGRAAPLPDELSEQAMRTLETLNTRLAHTLTLPAPTDQDWGLLYRIFVGAQSWLPTGWYMANVIVDQLGEARLQATRGSVADFFAAYQEAALAVPASPTADAGTVGWYLQAARPFSTENAAWLDVELRRRFP